MSQKHERAAGIPRSTQRHIAAKADCDLRTVTLELDTWAAGGESVSPARARVRSVVRQMARRGELPAAVLGALQLASAQP
jgi:hypothetical protein